MSIDLLGDLTEEACSGDKLFFDKGEVIEFTGIEPRVDEFKGHIYIKARVDSGIHQGKEHTIMIAAGDHDVTKKKRAMFFFKSGFFTADELKEKDHQGKSMIHVHLKKLCGRRFQGKASKVTERGGEKFQNIDDIKDLGPAPEGSAPATASTY